MNSPARITSSLDGSGRVRLSLESAAGRSEAQFAGRDIQLVPSSEAMITAAFLPAMILGTDLVADGYASPKYLKALVRLGDIYHAWHPGKLQKIAVRNVEPASTPHQPQARVGLFFTAGLDSFYTLLKHQDEITDLIYVHGFGGRPESAGLEPRKQDMVRRAADGLGKNVVEIDTDVRTFFEGHGLHWAHLGAGPALATIGHLMAGQFQRIYVAATHPYAGLRLWSSSPLLDPLWSTETLEFVHDGCEARRTEKARLVAESDVAMRTLRVCDRASPDAPNCGRCEKCLRTMMHLLAVGALERCTTFAEGPELHRVAAIRFQNIGFERYHTDNLNALEERGTHPTLLRTLRRNLIGTRRQMILRELLDLSWPGLLPTTRRIRRWLFGRANAMPQGAVRGHTIEAEQASMARWLE